MPYLILQTRCLVPLSGFDFGFLLHDRVDSAWLPFFGLVQVSLVTLAQSLGAATLLGVPRPSDKTHTAVGCLEDCRWVTTMRQQQAPGRERGRGDKERVGFLFRGSRCFSANC